MADNPRIEELRRRVQTDPASIAFAQLAEEYRRAGHFEDAVRVCRSGLERHPSYLSARVTLGRTLIELQRYDEARTELEYVLRSAPENLAAIRGLAEIHQRRGDLSEALRQYQTALGIARHDPELEESVHDLSRQLGGASAPPPPAAPPAPPIEIPESFGLHASEPPPVVDALVEPPSPAASLSPELEAAADEFTKALQALMIDLPAPPAAEANEAGEGPASAAVVSPELETAAELEMAHAPESSGEPESAGEPESPREPEPIWQQLGIAEQGAAVLDDAPPLDPPTPAPQMREPSADLAPGDAKIVGELEAWLDAIVLDRSERAAAGEGAASEAGAPLPDLPLERP